MAQRLLLVLSICLSLCFGNQSVAQIGGMPKAMGLKVVTIAADQWCPINCEPGSREEGIGVEVARAVFEPLGYKVQYKVMPWSRALDAVREGKVNAVIGANRSDDDTVVMPKNAIYNITDDFYVLKDYPLQYQGIKSLSGKRMGIIKDYGYSDEVKQYITDNKKIAGQVQEVGGEDALEQNINKLLARRIDVIIESGLVMDYTLKRLQMTDRIRRVGGVTQGNVYLAFSPVLPATKELVKQYDDGVERLRSEGSLKRIYAKYGLTP